MAVDGVNNSNNNIALYTAGAALVGGGTGVAAAYLTKPFLKDGAPTDAFIKKMNENLEAIMTPEEKELAKVIQEGFDNLKKSINDAQSIDELRELMVKTSTAGLDDETLKVMKESDDVLKDMFKSMGLAEKDYGTYSEIVKNSNSAEEFRNLLRKDFDNRYAGKTLEEIKNIELSTYKSLNDSAAKSIFNKFWDSSKKTFINCEEGAGKAIKKAAKSIQGKYAMIYGAIGAGVLGLATLLCCSGKKQPEQPQNIDQQA